MNFSSRLPFTRCLALALLSFAAVSSSAKPSTHFAIKVTEPTVRVPKAGFNSTVAGMAIRVNKEAVILGASTPDASNTELRTIRRQGDEVSMLRVDSVALAAGLDIVLRTGEGRYFLMLQRVKRVLKPGEMVPITLKVRSDEKVHQVKVNARVVAPRSYSPEPEEDEH